MKTLIYSYRYLVHWLRSSNENDVHPPFISDLLTSVIYVKTKYYPYLLIEKLREQLIDSKKKITTVDFGAGGKSSGSKKICTIASKSAKPARQAQLLFRLVNYFQPKNILELGTSLGLSTAYLSAANLKSKIITLEGSPETAKIATKNFKKLNLKNIEQVVGNFDDTLPKVIDNCESLDFVFFDGNHRKEPTLSYFKQCLKKANENTVFVFDDIYWSDEMIVAWNEIKKNEEATITIDLFFMGIVLFRKGQEKEHFSIRF